MMDIWRACIGVVFWEHCVEGASSFSGAVSGRSSDGVHFKWCLMANNWMGIFRVVLGAVLEELRGGF